MLFVNGGASVRADIFGSKAFSFLRSKIYFFGSGPIMRPSENTFGSLSDPSLHPPKQPPRHNAEWWLLYGGLIAGILFSWSENPQLLPILKRYWSKYGGSKRGKLDCKRNATLFFVSRKVLFFSMRVFSVPVEDPRTHF